MLCCPYLLAFQTKNGEKAAGVPRDREYKGQETLTETRYSDKAREFTLAQALNCSVDFRQRERL